MGLVIGDSIARPVPVADSSSVLYIEGDSIMNGQLATTEPQECVSILAAAYPGTVVNSSASGRPLYLRAREPAWRAARVAEVTAAGATDMWIQLGVNDWVLWDRTDLAEYIASYGALLDALHAALPSLHVWVQAPFITDLPDLNAGGESLQGFRNGCYSVASARNWCHAVNGGAGGGHGLVTADVSPDNVHFGNPGHAKIGAWMISLLCP
jgi:hypothetical protein